MLTDNHGGARVMLAAVTVWNGRISPVFDVSRESLLFAVESAEVVAVAGGTAIGTMLRLPRLYRHRR